MKILHIVYDFTPGHFPGGVPKIVHELAMAQHLLGHRVAVFSPQILSAKKNLSPNTLIEYPLDIHTPASLRQKNTFKSIEHLVSQFDVLHSHNTYLPLNFYTAFIGRRYNLPVFFHVHGALDPIVVHNGLLKSVKKRFYIKFIECWNLNQAQCIFAVTSAEKDQISSWGVRAPIEVIPHGIDPFVPPEKHMVRSFLEKHPILESKEIVLYLGRINEKKGVDLLSKAFANVADKFDRSLLVIAGNRAAYPSYVAELDKFIEEYSLTERVYWTGFLEEVDKRCLFSLAKVFSHVTKSEGMAVAVLEAMSAGLPVIVSPGCYMDQAVAEKAVMLSDYDAHSLAKVFVKMLGNRELCHQLGESAAQFTRFYHNWKTNAEKMIDCYKNGLSHESTP